MASVNRQSLREEFTALQDRFGQLSANGKIGAESGALIEALLMLLQVLMAIFLEKTTPKTSANSSKPSSQTPKDESALGRKAPIPRVRPPTRAARPIPAGLAEGDLRDRNGLDRAGIGRAAASVALPLVWAPSRPSALSSFGVCEEGLLELALVFGVVFSRKIAINT